MDEKIKVVDVVQLKSGSIDMTVNFFAEDKECSTCDCVYYFEGEFRYEENISVEVLKIIRR
jgi:uncharacterized protein YodC (DUF2158 family)